MSSFIVKTIGNTLNATSLVSSRYASRKALNLFASPRKGRYNEAQLRIVNSAKRKDLKYETLNIATYHWKGSGPTVLLAHGWESNASRWDYFLNELRTKDYNIVALDAPAHGNSDGKQFNALLYAQFMGVVAKDFSPQVIIGHSVGGMSAVFCQYYQELDTTKKLILLGAPAHFTGVFSRYKSMMGYNSKISNGLDDLVKEHFGKPVDYFSAANFAKSIETSTLIIHDTNDRIIPYEDALLFENRFKSAQLMTTTGLGHGLKSRDINNAILKFIEQS
ncbi:MAG: alpha/beta hydrolase [Winogradskyella sp.]|nr:alpha/beta hydrolase [Winogradskyella sp.]